jgi:Zn-dependent protease/CBS domain-containing protein
MFGKSIKIFGLLGFQVKIDLSWLILALLVTWSLARGYFPFRYENLPSSTYWIMGAFGTVGLFLSIVLHELGHSIISRKQGIPMKGITLFIFGGVAEMNEEPPTARSEFFMAIIGPIVSVVLGVGFYLIYNFGKQIGWPVPVSGVFYYLGWINLLLAVFNMMPAFPLDGGRVLRSFLWSREGNLRKATHSASRIGSGFGAFLIGLGVLSILFGSFIGGMWWFLIGMFLRNAAKSSYIQMEIRKALKGEPIGRFMNQNPVTVPANISVHDFVHDYVYTRHFHMFPVAQESKILGCIGTKEVKKIPKEEWELHSVQEMLSPCSKYNTVSPETDAMDVLSILQRTGSSRLLVMDQDRLAGVVSLKDLLRFLSLKLDLEGEEGEELFRNQQPLSSNR